jgi:hypothetical protein
MFTVNQPLTLDQIAVLRGALKERIDSLEKQIGGRNGALAQKTIAVAQATEKELEASQNELLSQFGVTIPSAPAPQAPAKRGPKAKAAEGQQAQLPS